ncbi:MAG TPA: STAS domain-containing protein [Terriglobales bacterium]|jgi:anti-sigma B factor antagonist|nr:STAS domain-containing protein [Terriglobales bacterium]
MREELLQIEDVGILNGKHTLKLIGPLTISTLFEFQNLVRASAGSLLVDMTQVPYIDSAGVGALVGAYVRHNKDGHTLTLAGVNERVRNILKGTRVEQFFSYADSIPQLA